MSKLKAITPKATPPKRPKVLVFGKSGAGKTWASLDFPAAYFIDTEGGASGEHYQEKLLKSGGMYFGPDCGALDFAEVLAQVKALTVEKHTYKTLVIDSITKLFAVTVSEEADRLGDKDAFGASKKPAVSYMRRLVTALTRLDMNVILIAHEMAEWGLVGGQRSEIGRTFDCWDKLEYELDLCLQVEKKGPSRTARVRKSRLTGFPEGEAFPWGYADFAKRYGRDVIESNVMPLDLATQDQLKELERLIKTVRLPDDWEEKCLKKLNAENWEDVESDKIDSAINCIKTKFINNENKGE